MWLWWKQLMMNWEQELLCWRLVQVLQMMLEQWLVILEVQALSCQLMMKVVELSLTLVLVDLLDPALASCPGPPSLSEEAAAADETRFCRP